MEEQMKATIDLMDSKKLYVVKDGRLIKHELPEYGETVVIITMGGQVDRIETTIKRKL
ncbi:hypothetical protein GCM10011391_28240 [Pullulanibacillus camelliae]|uniref:DUF3954 domain-containing protein n=1 Tax=Pullulanibacillus camelliae TaxID=1707096 RepID=A0A8J3DYV4_9BACL|nr:DUF3954 domain-containing protein [Pullulanibacillus camelliae]GGE47841.1 hypothetical protein GCM10011391_28240 [Pullulanibacillus camelliae]